MKKFLTALVLLRFISGAFAATPLPSDLVGIWAGANAKFNGEILIQGIAIYLDSDGIGSALAVDGDYIANTKLAVTDYDPEMKIITFDYREQGKVIASGKMSYDPIKKVLSSTTNARETYELYANTISTNTRQKLGFEKRDDIAPAPITINPNKTEFHIPFYRIRTWEFK